MVLLRDLYSELFHCHTIWLTSLTGRQLIMKSHWSRKLHLSNGNTIVDPDQWLHIHKECLQWTARGRMHCDKLVKSHCPQYKNVEEYWNWHWCKGLWKEYSVEPEVNKVFKSKQAKYGSTQQGGNFNHYAECLCIQVFWYQWPNASNCKLNEGTCSNQVAGWSETKFQRSICSNGWDVICTDKSPEATWEEQHCEKHKGNFLPQASLCPLIPWFAHPFCSRCSTLLLLWWQACIYL